MSHHHRIDYIEISVSDLKRARTFYEAAFGWSFQEYGPAYAGIQGEGREVGGLCVVEELSAQPSSAPLVILYSDELEGSVRAVRDAGGTITQPIYAFPGGRRFHFADTEGNQLAVWSKP